MEPVIKTIKLKDANGSGSEMIAAEQVSDDTFRLLENPVFNCKINYGTTVKVIEDANGDLVMSKIIRASDYKTRLFMLSRSLNEMELRTKIGQPILDAGGMWEVVFGGIAFIHIPKDSSFNIDELFKINNYFPTEIIDDTKGGV